MRRLAKRLRRLLRRHRRRMALSFLIAAGGYYLLKHITNGYDVAGWKVNLLLSLPMTLVSYLANWRFVWHDRQVPFTQGLWKWLGKWAVTMPISQALFIALTENWGMSLLEGRIIVGIVVGPISYAVNAVWVFGNANLKKMLIFFLRPFRRQRPMVALRVREAEEA